MTANLPSIELAVTSGSALKAGVGPGRKFQVTPLGIRFLGKMTFEQYTELLSAWKVMKDSWDYGLADIVAYGRENFGDDRVAEVLTQLEYEMIDTVRAYAIGQTLLDLRTTELTSEHYYVLGNIDDETARHRWAKIALKEELSALELKKSINAGQVVRLGGVSEASGRNSGIANMQGLKFWFGRWERQAGGHEQIVAWPEEKKKSLLEELKPLLELGMELAESLGIQLEKVVEKRKEEESKNA